MGQLKFTIVTPERTVLTEDVDSVTCTTSSGQITVLPGHIPLISSIEHGELVARVGGNPEHYAVSGGIIEVKPGNQVTILADTAEHSDEIDEERAEEARRRAQESMKNASKLSQEEYVKLLTQLQRNLVRLKVAKRSMRKAPRGPHVQ